MNGLDRMVENGRVTVGEVERLRAATDPEEFDAIIRGIRVRHAQAKLNAAVASGRVTQAVADANLAGLEDGEHPQGLRALLGRHS